MTECCDSYGNCTRGPDCPARPSCDELAVCQSREPACRDCHPVSEGTRSARVIWDALKDRALSFTRAK